MARYLYLAGGFMLLWQFVRFLQEAYLYKNIHLLRVSGYFTVFPLIVTTLFDLYAALCLGNGESYSIPRSLFLLAIPDAFLVILELTNESHNMVFRVLPDEEENIEFHTNYGFVIILIFAAVLILSKIYIIYHKTRIIKQNRRLKIFPFMIGMAIPIVILPHLINQFVPGGEFIDFTAKLYFLEIMSWESCIIIGREKHRLVCARIFRFEAQNRFKQTRIIEKFDVLAYCFSSTSDVLARCGDG